MAKECSVDDCTTSVDQCGMCTKHYKRWYRYGDVNYVKVHRYVPGSTEQWCNHCKQMLPLDDFYSDKNRPSGRQARCKKCQYLDHLSYDGRNKMLKARYGITVEDWDRMLIEQAGRCAICGDHEQELVVDHDHETGAVRGLLCGGCNTGIGQLKDNVDTLASAMAYLLQSQNVLGGVL